MTIILPYNNGFEDGEGGFIKPNGEMLFSTISGNEKTAMEYCNGRYFEDLREIITNFKSGIFDERTACLFFRFMEKNPNFKGEPKDLNEYQSSNLNAAELELYKKWFFVGDHRLTDATTDFMKFILGCDVVYPDWLSKRIISPDERAFTRLYNFALMDWTIIRETKKYWDEKTKTFKFIETEETWRDYERDRKEEVEIMRLKREVPLERRHEYFK